MPYAIYNDPGNSDPVEILEVIDSANLADVTASLTGSETYAFTNKSIENTEDFYVQNGTVKEKTTNRTYSPTITSEYSESTETNPSGVKVHYVDDWDGVKISFHGDEAVNVTGQFFPLASPYTFSPGSGNTTIKFVGQGNYEIEIVPPLPEAERVFSVDCGVSAGRFTDNNKSMEIFDVVQIK